MLATYGEFARAERFNDMKLLIGYDGSKCADNALDGLKYAGLPRKAETTVLCIAEVSPLPPPSSYELVNRCLNPEEDGRDGKQEPEGPFGDWKAQTEKAARLLASQAATRLQQAFKEWDVHDEFRFGSPAAQIINKADEWQPDLIVLGSHGRSGISRIILGSVSQRVLTDARTSVRIARGRIKRAALPPRIIIAVDGSAGADCAVRTVAERSWPGGTEVLLLAVTDPIHATTIGRLLPTVGEVVDQYNELERASAERIVASCAKILANSDLAITTSVTSGDPRRVLCDETDRWAADSIFLGARGLGRFDRLLLGSVSSAVAAHAHCSVEVVRQAAIPKTPSPPHEAAS
jgi:nucleotide-binding universal stress UspA family protein